MINEVFPQVHVQTGIGHPARYSLNYTSCKIRKAAASSLRLIHAADTVAGAERTLDTFAPSEMPSISTFWRHN